MGEIDRKNFDMPSIKNFIACFLFIVLALTAIMSAIYMSEQDIHDYLGSTVGNSEDKAGRGIMRVIFSYFGKPGFVFGVSIFGVIVFYEVYKFISKYLRYKRKCKLFHEGLIENFYDIYDDHRPTPLWRKLLNLFHKKGKTNKQKYPTKRILKNKIKEQDAFFDKF